MIRVKCIFENQNGDKPQRFVVVIPESIHSISQFIQHCLKNYIHCSTSDSVTLLLDGFEIQQEETLSVIHPDDILTIRYSNKKEKKEKHEKKKEKCITETFKDEGITHIQHTNSLQDGYYYPENKITVFEPAAETSEDTHTPLLRILPNQTYSGGNTNTPTVNAKDSKKKTRRGKRGGKKSQNEQSFLDFIVHEEPSVVMDSSIKEHDADPSLRETSAIEQVNGNDSLCDLPVEKSLPKIGDVVHFPYVVMNYDSGSPEVQNIKGVVKNLNGTHIVIYSEQLDDIVKFTHEEFATFQNSFVFL